MKKNVHRFDQHMTQWVVVLFGNSSHRFLDWATRLGDPVSILIITVCIVGYGLYYSEERLAAAGLMIPVTVIVGAVLKILFERARPLSDYAMSMKIKTFSFPSGHSSGSTIAFGLIAIIALSVLEAPLDLLVGGLAAIVPVVVGISRVYLGAHFPSDVIAGWLLGIAALVVVMSTIRPLT